MSRAGATAYTPRHAASPQVGEPDPTGSGWRDGGAKRENRRRRRAIVAAAVALIALPACVMLADSGGPRGTFDGGVAEAPPSALPEPETSAGPSDATTTPPPAPSDAPTVASPAPATTAPGGAAGAQTLRPVGPGTPRRSTPTLRRSTPTPRPVPRPAPPPDAGPGPERPGPERPTPGRPTPGRPTPAPPTAPGGQPPWADRCGAPENPHGYTYCGGKLVHEPAAGVCNYFTCVDGFWAGKGYLIVCDDGRIGMIGGSTGRCPERAGRKDPVYADQQALE